MDHWTVFFVLIISSCICVHAAFPCGRSLFGIDSSWVNVNFTIWVQQGSDPAYFQASVEVMVPAKATYFDMMRIAAVKDSRFKFTALNDHVGHNVYVTTINGMSEDVSALRFWMLYLLSGPPDPANLPSNLLLTPRTVDGMIVQDGDNILFWLHEFIFLHP